MNKRILKTVLLILLLPVFALANPANYQVNFIEGKLSSIQKRAAQEGKLYLIHFTAEWCMPCQWMEKNTYTDPELASYINANFLPYKVDIDDTEGYNYKEKFSILLLPSVLIFNSSGELLDKFEESLSASKMLLILKAYNTPENRERVKPSFLVADNEEEKFDSDAAFTNNHSQSNTYERIESVPSENDYYIKQEPVTQPVERNTEPSKQDYSSNTYNSSPTQNYSTRRETELPPRPVQTNTTTTTSNEPPTKGYGVQIGAFSNYTSVQNQARKYESQFGKPVNIYPAQSKGKTIYKMVIGEFSSKTAANEFMYLLKSKSINGFVKNLADF